MTKHIYYIISLISILLTSCAKDDEVILEDGVSVVVTDLEGDIEGSMGEDEEGNAKSDFDVFLFRFSDQKQIWLRNAEDSARWLKTDEWDLAFTGPYNSEVYVNNANDRYNPGYGGPAKAGAVLMRDIAYDQITEAPTDAEFDNSDIILIGWAQKASAYGWFYYSLDNHIMVPIKNRTWLIRLADGKYAKLELINIYKGNPPVVTDLFWAAPYFTFRYYLQEDGSKNLRTK